MPKIIKGLTNTQVEKAKPEDGELNDGAGLFLQVSKIGTKTWRFRYNHPTTGKRTKITIGTYPAVSLAQARTKREEYRALLAQGIDPHIHKEQQAREKELASNNTFLAVALRWKEKKAGEIEPKTLVKYWRSLELHVLPFIGAYPVAEIVPTLAITPLRRVEARNTLDMVQRLTGYINEILNFAVNSGLIPFNPCLKMGTVFQRVNKQNNPRIKSEELPQFMQSLANARIEPQTRALIQFQLLTMVRPSEASQAQWAEIDLDKALWTIPAERMKQREAHIVPLSRQAISLLKAQYAITGRFAYVFTKYGNHNQPMNASSANMAIKRMGYGGRQTAHGLRGLARTYLAEQSINHEHAEACLAHRTGGNVSLAYNHATYLEQRKEIMQFWGDFIEHCSIIKTI